MTKIDLEKEGEVSFKEAIDFAYAMKCELFTTSSKDNIKVNELFEKIALIFVKNKYFDEYYEEYSLSKNQSLYTFSNKSINSNSNDKALEDLDLIKNFKLKIMKKENKNYKTNLKNKTKNNFFQCKI
jgi:hypothetical protein